MKDFTGSCDTAFKLFVRYWMVNPNLKKYDATMLIPTYDIGHFYFYLQEHLSLGNLEKWDLMINGSF